jgi:hypothetical protein
MCYTQNISKLMELAIVHSRKTAIITGSVLFFMRLIFCVLFALLAWAILALDTVTSLGTNEDMMYFYYINVLAFAFGIQALTDTILILGAWNKSAYAIYVWGVAQLLTGGLLGVIGFGIVIWKPYQEQKKEDRQEHVLHKI